MGCKTQPTNQQDVPTKHSLRAYCIGSILPGGRSCGGADSVIDSHITSSRLDGYSTLSTELLAEDHHASIIELSVYTLLCVEG